MLFHVCLQRNPNFTRNLGAFPTTAPAAIGPRAIFPFNGQYTPELDKWIETFQQTANTQGYGPLTVDGRVSPAPVGWGKKAKGGGWYTIQALNLLMFKTCEQRYSALPDLSDIPRQLAGDLKLIVLPDS
jgi:hypothetical protein